MKQGKVMSAIWEVTRRRWPYLVLLLAGLLLVWLGFAAHYSFSVEQFKARDLSEESIRVTFGRLQSMMVGCGILLIVATPLLYLFRHRLAELVVPIFHSGDDFYADKGRKRKAFDLFWISFLGLFLEMLIIRWLSTEFRLFAYFKNRRCWRHSRAWALASHWCAEERTSSLSHCL